MNKTKKNWTLCSKLELLDGSTYSTGIYLKNS